MAAIDVPTIDRRVLIGVISPSKCKSKELGAHFPRASPQIILCS